VALGISGGSTAHVHYQPVYGCIFPEKEVDLEAADCGW
jgi:hypothetical protein